MAADGQRFYRTADVVPPGEANASDQQSSVGSFTRVGESEASRTRKSTQSNSQENDWVWCQAVSWIEAPNVKVWVSKQDKWGHVPEELISQANPASNGAAEVADLGDWDSDWKCDWEWESDWKPRY